MNRVSSFPRHGRILLPCLAFLLSLFCHPAPSRGENTGYLEQLQARAEQENLHKSRYWHILLHYKTAFGGIESLIDDPDFFLAPQGKTRPGKELQATLAGLFDERTEDSPRCRFVARYDWLARELDIDANRLPAVSCPEFEATYAKVEPRSAALVFPGTHNNSPASMFGHTLISIRGPYESRLLAWAVNYSAFTRATNGFTYAVKGIFGLYPGYYSVLPFSEKLRTYNDMERRDVWEYELNLSPEEVRRLFLHTWELREIHSDYYFFDENCAYNLLFLLEAARPSLNLTDQCRPWVIPIDTVRIVNDAGLTEEAIYRPSKATRIGHIASYMDGEEERLTRQLIARQLSPEHISERPLPPASQVRILDLAAEALEFQYIREQIDRKEFRHRYVSLLGERSRLGTVEEAYGDFPRPVRPDAGHGSNRLGIGAGVRDDDVFAEIQVRPAYHNLLDNDAGYLAGSQIDFANLVLRHHPERDKTELHEFDLVNIVSLSPRNPFFKPVSWKVEAGLEQKFFADGNDHLVALLNPGGGFAYGNFSRLAYALVETDLHYSGRYQDNYLLGFGGSAGLLASIGDSWKVHLWGRNIHYEVGDKADQHQQWSLRLDQNIRISSDNSVNLQLSRHGEGAVHFTEAVLAWNYYW